MARLIVQPPQEKQTLDICVDRDYFLIGRGVGCDLVIRDVRVSRFHATIFRYEQGLYLSDHSMNGTSYDGCLVKRWAGYVQNKLETVEDVESAVLRLLDDPEKCKALVANAVRLQHECCIGFPLVKGSLECLFLDPQGT